MLGKDLTVNGDGNDSLDFTYIEDLVQGVILSITNKNSLGEIFNITDNQPCSSEEVTTYAAKLLKIENLSFIDVNSPKINKITRDFYMDNKKVSNKKIKKILGWTPKFENYKLGLKKILDSINGKGTANNSLS